MVYAVKEPTRALEPGLVKRLDLRNAAGADEPGTPKGEGYGGSRKRKELQRLRGERPELRS